MRKILLSLFCVLTMSLTSMAATTTLFHESFGDNSNSARDWSDSYSVKSGEQSVFQDIAYSLTNIKQSKNTVGQVKSGLTQSGTSQDAVFIAGPFRLEKTQNVALSYYWKASSIKDTYYTNIYYSTDGGLNYSEIQNSAIGKTTFVEVKVDVPDTALTDNTFFKIVFKTSNTSAIIDEFDLQGELKEPDTPVNPDQVNIPIISPAGGTITVDTEISISCPTEDATILYAFNDGNFDTYTVPFTISESVTVKAKAIREGMTDSEVATAEFVINNSGSETSSETFRIADTIDVNKEYIIYGYSPSVNAGYLMGDFSRSGSNNYGFFNAIKGDNSNFSLTDNIITINNAKPVIVKFEKADDSSFYIIAGDNYISANTANSNGCLYGTKNETNGKATVNFDTDKQASINFTTGKKTNFRFNGTSGQERFTCYSSGQQLVKLYERITEVEPSTPADIDLKFVASAPSVFVDDSEAKVAEAIEVTVAEGFNVSDLTWSSSNTEVADFVGGKLKINKAGTTVITASFDGNEKWNAASVMCTLNVIKHTTTLSFSKPEITLNNNATEEEVKAATPTLSADGMFDLGNAAITWSSSNENLVIVIDGELAIDDSSTGEAIITASFTGNEAWSDAEASYKVTVVNPTIQPTEKKDPAFDFIEGPLRLVVEEDITDLRQYLVAAEGFDKGKVEWKSTKPEICDVEEGIAYPYKVGTAIIYARFAGDETWKEAETNCKIIVIGNNVETTTSTVTFDFTIGNQIQPGYENSITKSYVSTLSNSPQIFTADFNTNSGDDGEMSYVENKGWQFSSASEESSYHIYINSKEFDSKPYFMKGIRFETDFDTDLQAVTIKANNESAETDIDNYEWTGEAAYMSFEVQTLGPGFIINKIFVTFEHDVIEKPDFKRVLENGEAKVYITHPLDDHTIMHRITTMDPVSGKKRVATEYTEYTRETPITVLENQVVETYAVHPHGMTSETNSMDHTLFNHIITGIDNIDEETGNDVRYFNLQGAEVNDPDKGVYIRVKDGKAAKVRL